MTLGLSCLGVCLVLGSLTAQGLSQPEFMFLYICIKYGLLIEDCYLWNLLRQLMV